MPTPYDGKVGLWHVAGGWVGEDDIEELAHMVKTKMPSVDAIFVKTNDGNDWEGTFDTKESMEINGPEDIAKWVTTLADYGLGFHAWCVVKGEDVQGEIDRIIETCRVPGVRSMILDVEPYSGFWEASRQEVLDLMSGVRSAIGNTFHIGMCVDPRSHRYDAIFPDAWRPYINSVHPQIYWELMKRDGDSVLNEAYVVWGNYGLPIIPVLEGYAEPDSLSKVQDLARSVRGAPGLSYFRLGVIGPRQYPVINEEVVSEEVGPDQILRRYGWEKIVTPDDSGYRDGSHTGDPTSELFKTFTSARGYTVKYKNTEPDADKIWVRWNPKLPEKGLYEVSVYVPGHNATSQHVQYHIHGITGRGTELLVRFNQSLFKNQWVPLVVYEFSGEKGSGVVNCTDLTGESGKEIAFAAVRWRQVIEQDDSPFEEAVSGAGFDPPVGTAEERLSAEVWPGDWYDATGFATYYTVVGPAYHTGADLNLPRDADKHDPIYTIGDGWVTYSARSAGTWGNVIVIRHDALPDGTQVWSRYAHIENPLVKEGERVERGQQIASIGDSEGQLPYHLHFDIAITDIMERRPGHWPGNDLGTVLKHYTDPKEFLLQHRPPGRG